MTTRSAGRLLEVHDRRQRLVLGDHRLGGIVGGVLAAGQHHRHRVADVTDLADRERQMRRRFHIGSDRPGARQRTGPLPLQIWAGEGGHHPGQGQGRRHVDGADAGVRHRAAHHGGVQRTRHHQVGDKTSFTAEQGRILPAPDPGADDSWRNLDGGHDAALAAGAWAAARTALTMLW
jgi:hypothetical protein